MMCRHFAILFTMLCLAPACALPGHGKTAAYVVDVAIVGGGLALMAADCNSQDSFLAPSECDLNDGMGTVLIMGGLIGALVNAALMPDPPAEAESDSVTMNNIDCETALGWWRAENDVVRKTQLYESLPAWCQTRAEGAGDVAPRSFGPPGL